MRLETDGEQYGRGRMERKRKWREREREGEEIGRASCRERVSSPV